MKRNIKEKDIPVASIYLLAEILSFQNVMMDSVLELFDFPEKGRPKFYSDLAAKMKIKREEILNRLYEEYGEDLSDELLGGSPKK